MNSAIGKAHYEEHKRYSKQQDEEAEERTQTEPKLTKEEADKRLFIRGEVSAENKKLFSTAKGAGVTKFGSFNDAGYKGLYGMPLSNIESRKGIKKGELLDRAGTTELAANLFRATQAEDKLRRERVRGKDKANQVHFEVGKKVRQTIKELGGTMPESLPLAENIKKIASKNRKQIKNS